MRKLVCLFVFSIILSFGQSFAGNAKWFEYNYKSIMYEFNELSFLEEVLSDDIVFDRTISIDSLYSNYTYILKISDLGLQMNLNTPIEPCQQALIDVNENYDATGAFLGPFCVSSTLNPIFGAITAGIIVRNPPKEKNLRMPNNEYSNNYSYKKCYSSYAHQKKKKSAWFGVGAGSVLYTTLLIIYFSSY